ncbi:MAG: SDR family oxidoreductase [Verrucomicrobia bacterium]|nr:SDR family oxidoreductase [Verrucomicrobiota bacterium]
MDSGLRDKVALITGASGGIGAGTAHAFAAEGAQLVLHYHRNRRSAETLRAELAGTRTLTAQADLTRPDQVKRLFARAHEAFGRVDILVANAGSWIAKTVPIHQLSLAQWRLTLDTNLTSAFLCCREFFRLVRRQRHGNVVLVSSTAGVFGEAGHADYAAAKAALAYGLTRTLKNELARLAPHTPTYCGGRANCVCPGWTLTPMTRGQLKDRALVRRVTATMALPQIARVEDVAHAIVFLASDRLARHITGQTLLVAGGMEGRWLWQPEEVDPHAA